MSFVSSYTFVTWLFIIIAKTETWDTYILNYLMAHLLSGQSKIDDTMELSIFIYSLSEIRFEYMRILFRYSYKHKLFMMVQPTYIP